MNMTATIENKATAHKPATIKLPAENSREAENTPAAPPEEKESALQHLLATRYANENPRLHSTELIEAFAMRYIAELKQQADTAQRQTELQKAHSEAKQQKLDQNRQKSEARARLWARQNHINDEALSDLLSYIRQEMELVGQNILTIDLLNGYLRRITFADKLKQATHEAYVKGRNESIEEHLAGTFLAGAGDGVPQQGRSTGNRNSQPVLHF